MIEQLFQLFWSFVQIGAFSVGGGFAAMPLIQHQVVDLHHWLTMAEFADVVTISEMTPGPIAINSATFVGTRIAGLPGALVATLGCVLPSCIIVLTISYFFFKYRNLAGIQGVLSGLRPAVVALIATAGISMLSLVVFGGAEPVWNALTVESFDFIAIGLFIVAFVVLRLFKKVSPIQIMLGTGVVGGILYLCL